MSHNLRAAARAGTVVAALASAGALAACGNDPSPPALKQRTSPQQVMRSVPWNFIRADDRDLVLGYSAGTCGRANGEGRAVARVNETSEMVTIEVRALVVESNPCAGLLVGGEVRVLLDRPLRDRELHHAPVAPGQRGLEGNEPGSGK